MHYQILLPGETRLPGSGLYSAGLRKIGIAESSDGRGTAISVVEVRLVDDYFNQIKSGPALPYVVVARGLRPARAFIDQYAPDVVQQGDDEPRKHRL